MGFYVLANAKEPGGFPGLKRRLLKKAGVP